jgi:uncharacterized protein (TIGR00730 family)
MQKNNSKPRNISAAEEKESLGLLTTDSWKLFKVMAEFVEGYHMLATQKNEVTVFGSARLMPYDEDYKKAERMGELLGKNGYVTVTGGGPGIMEAASKGAFSVGGRSLGLGIRLPREQRFNHYLTDTLQFDYFFSRKVMLTSPSQAFVVFPGGYGTLDEMFQVINECNLGYTQRVPIILVGRKFWTPLLEFLQNNSLSDKKVVTAQQLSQISIVETPDEAFKIVSTTKDYPNLGHLDPNNFVTASRGVNWRIFRVMAELVEGFEFLAQVSPAVTVLGTSKMPRSSDYYETAYRLSDNLVKEGFNIVTGGGFGVAEAANKAAFDNEKNSYGLSLKKFFRRGANEYVTQDVLFEFPYTRQFILIGPANSYVFFPGGLGTLHQLFELLTLQQTEKIDKKTIILYGSEFWNPLWKYVREYLDEQYHTIAAKDVHLVTITDNENEVLELIKKTK